MLVRPQLMWSRNYHCGVVPSQASRHLRTLGRKHAAKHIGEGEISIFCDALILAIMETLDDTLTEEGVWAWVHLLAVVGETMTRDKVRYLPKDQHLRRIGAISEESVSSSSSSTSYSYRYSREGSEAEGGIASEEGSGSSKWGDV